MLTLGAAKVLGRLQSGTVARVLAADPAVACMVAARFEKVGMDRTALGGQFWGIGGGREALCFDGGNLIPLHGDADGMRAIAAVAGRKVRQCASVVGPAELVQPLWQALEPSWGPARAIRPDQPLLACSATPPIAVDPFVRPAVPSDLERYYPAAVDMFTSEVGVDPREPDNGVGYRNRLIWLLEHGRAFVRFDDDGQVMFKAEIGSLSSRAALIQGVWVSPRHRGEGLAAPALAAMVRSIQSTGRLPVLYVNSFNTPARAAYRRLGFEQIGTFSSVLF